METGHAKRINERNQIGPCYAVGSGLGAYGFHAYEARRTTSLF